MICLRSSIALVAVVVLTGGGAAAGEFGNPETQAPAEESVGGNKTDCSEFYEPSFDQILGLTNYSYKDDPIECISPVEEYVDEENTRPDFLYSWSSGPRAVLFYAPWCHYSQDTKPAYIEFARKVEKELEATGQEARFLVVSCEAHSTLCEERGIKHFPTLKLFRGGSIAASPKSMHVSLGMRYAQLHSDAHVDTIAKRVQGAVSDAVKVFEMTGTYSFLDHPSAEESPLRIYNGSSDEPDFLYSSKVGARAVLFYSPSGFTPEVVPGYLEYARNFSFGAEAGVRVAGNMTFHVVSCVDNPALCAKQNITRTPRFKLFRSGSTVEYPGSENILRKITSAGKSLASSSGKHQLGDQIKETVEVARLADYSIRRGESGQVIDYSGKEADPEFLLSSADDAPKAILFYSPKTGYAPWVQQFYAWLAGNLTRGDPWESCYRRSSPLSWALTARETKFYAVSCDAHPHLCAKLNITATPALKIFQAGNRTPQPDSPMLLAANLHHCQGGGLSYLCDEVSTEFKGHMCTALDILLKEKPKMKKKKTTSRSRQDDDEILSALFYLLAMCFVLYRWIVAITDNMSPQHQSEDGGAVELKGLTQAGSEKQNKREDEELAPLV